MTDGARELPAEIDVLVVGYGPVGAAMACLLGTYGASTLVLDRSPDVWPGPRAIALDNEALRILQLAGLADDAFPRLPIPYVRMRSPQLGELAKLDTAGSIDEHPKLVTFYQPDLEHALRRQVATHASVTSAAGIELVSFVDEGDLVRATLRTSEGAEHVVLARYLVGADGASSQVRAAIGEAFVGETYGEDWLVVDALDVPGGFDHVEFLCDHRRPTPHMVAPGGRTRWEFMMRPGETRQEMERAPKVRELLASWPGTSELRIERTAVYRFHARSCARFGRGRVFLVGDAAHVSPPFIGQGLVAGLRDAANLAWKLAWVLRRDASTAILDTYDEERRPHAKKMIALAKWMGRLVMPRSLLAALLVHGAMKLARTLPWLRRFIEALGVKPKPLFGRGLFAPPRRGPLRRGALFPQVLLRAPGGEVVRSDDVLGPRLALVGFGTDVHLSEATRARWSALYGTSLMVGPGGHVPIDDASLFARLVEKKWCAVLRPDRTILHDGPAADAERITADAIALLREGQREGS